MKRIVKYTAIITAFLTASFCSKSQSTITIGAANNNGGAYPLYSPVYRYSATSATTHVRSNILFTQAELAAAGLPQGAIITAVEFNKVLTSNFIIPADFKMYMANSTLTGLSNTTGWSSILSSHSLVYSNNSFNIPPTEGWVSWNLAPFTYTGGALEIATDLIMSGSGATNGYWTWQFDASVPTNLIIGNTGTGTAPAVLSGTNGNYLRRPNIRITYTTTPLPVKLVQFNGKRKDAQIHLQWIVEQDDQLHAYEIEQSFDGINYSKIATRLTMPVTLSKKLYAMTLDYPGRLSYYRLKMVDKDGHFSFSPIIQIASANNSFNVQFFPLPFKDKIFCSINTPSPEKVQVKVYNMQGELLKQFENIINGGLTLIPLHGLNVLIKGMYLAEVIVGGNRYTQLIVK